MKAPHSLRDEKLAPMPRTKRSVQVARREYFSLNYAHGYANWAHSGCSGKKMGNVRTPILFSPPIMGSVVVHHGLLGKQNMYDHSIRVPYVVVGPEVEAGKRGLYSHLHSGLGSDCT